MVSPSGPKTRCPCSASLRLFGRRRKKGVAIHALNSSQEKEKSSNESSTIDSAIRISHTTDNKRGDHAFTAELSRFEASSARAGDGDGQGELSAMFCATRLSEPSQKVALSRSKSSVKFWDEALASRGGEHFPFVFSEVNYLESSSLPGKSPPSRPVSLSMLRQQNTELANRTADNRSLIGNISSLRIETPSYGRNSTNSNMEQYRGEPHEVENEENDHQQEGQQQPLLQRPRFSTRWKSFGASSFAPSLSGEISAAPMAPRWPLDSSVAPMAPTESHTIIYGSAPRPSSFPKAKRETSRVGRIGEEGRKERRTSSRRARIKSTDMVEDMQQDALACTTQAMDECDIDEDIAAFIKKEFDSKYGAKWHCVVGENFGSFVTHESRGFVYLCRGKVAVLLFKAG